MKLNENCLSCFVNQTIKVMQMTNATNRQEIYRAVFQRLSDVDFQKTAPELCGSIYLLMREKLSVDDPYEGIRQSCNRLMLKLVPDLRKELASKEDPFRWAVHYAILGNIIDFSAPGSLSEESILQVFSASDEAAFAIDDTAALEQACRTAKNILYVGDNCGEVAVDALLLKEIHRLNPDVQCTYAVRAVPVVNDVIASDAETCGILPLANVIDTGDYSQGAVPGRNGKAFQEAYEAADVVISKGQGNYEGLSEQPDDKIFCLLMAKCKHIAGIIGVSVGDRVVLRLSPDMKL